MAEIPKSRLSLDLEEIERQLRRSSPGTAPSKSDPLAELARIVGQDDPFRALLADERPAAPRRAGADDVYGRREPSFDDPAEQAGGGAYGMRGSLAADEAAYAAAYRDQPVALTREEEAILHGHHAHGYADPHDPNAYYDDAPDYAEGAGAYAPVPRRRRRKGLMAAAALVAVGALAGAGAWTLRSGSMLGPDGEPPVVKADIGPAKIVPQNPGGIDIPNQNKKIYEPVAQETQTRVVNREEQPIDIRQAIRTGGSAPEAGSAAAPVRVSPAVPSNTASGVAPSLQGSSNAIAGFLGEPRRVKTVSIRPDGTIIPSEPGAAARPSAAASPLAAVPDARPAAAANLPPSLRPRDPAAPAAAPRPSSIASVLDGPAGAPLQITPDAARPKTDTRLAAAPAPTVREPTETSATPAAGSGFTVQLGVRNTDREARQAFEQVQQRHAGDLSGFAPLIVQAEIAGKTAYRVRVGPMSRDDAASLCTRLKASGGQCFVANN